MKPIKFGSLILAILLSTGTVASASDIFSVKTALNAQSARKTFGMTMADGDILEFSASDLERRLGLKPQSLNGITVTELPKQNQGSLVIDGVDVTSFEFISRDELERLCFVPNEEVVSANLVFIPKADDSTPAELMINISGNTNLAPEIQDASYDAMYNMAISGYITANDPDNDDMSVRVIKHPEKGVVQFDGLSFKYTPFKDVSGKDSFTICAVDSMNNFSREAVMVINIEKQKNSFSYADMQNHPSAYAAVKLHRNGIISGKQIGSKYFFYPDDPTSRGEFIVMMISSIGLETSMKPTVNTGLPNDLEIPSYLKPYVKKAVDEGIWAPDWPFYHNQIPTRAEAVVLTARAAKINYVKDLSLVMSDASSIPDWAIESYKSLSAYKMLDLYENVARPFNALSNSYSADLLWQLWKYCDK